MKNSIYFDDNRKGVENVGEPGIPGVTVALINDLDGSGVWDEDDATFTVTAVNHAPVVQSQSVTTAEDTVKAITLVATYVDSDSLTCQVITQPTHGTLSGTAPNLTNTPALNYAGSDRVTFTTSDVTINSNTSMVSITITPVNDAPTNMTLSNNSVAENQPVNTIVGTLTTNDPDASNTFTYSIAGGDIASFNIDGSSLQTSAMFDY